MTGTHDAFENSRIRRRVLETVKRTIREHEMLACGNAVLVGVSGGPDSMALLHVLGHLTPAYGLRLAVAHLNHGLRKEAEREAEFVAALAARLGLACYVQKEDVSVYRRRHRLSLEEAARRLRYTFFDDIAARHRFDKIAVGHQADDNAELMLMFLIRGSGPVGLAGIPPVRSKRVIRPLIRLARRDIINYLKAVDWTPVTDGSNQDNRFTRNRIRNRLLPLLRRSYNPKVEAALNRLSEIQWPEQVWIEGVVDGLYKAARLAGDNRRVQLSIPVLMRHPRAAQRRILRKAIADLKGDLRRISLTHIEAGMDLLCLDRRQGRLDLPEGIVLERIGNRLEAFKRGARPRPGTAKGEKTHVVSFLYEVKKPIAELTLVIEEIDGRVTFTPIASEAAGNLQRAGQRVAFFDMNRLIFPLTLRNVRAGDRFRPFGLKGSQKIKKYFVDHKVPQEKRWGSAVLLSGGRIIWLIGHRAAEQCRVTPDTHDILRVEITCLTTDRD